MEYLRSRQLDKYISALTQPVLGICLGMQLLCKYSEEDDTNCLGIFDQNVKKIKGALKVPHTGWNNIASYKSVLFAGLRPNEYMYFVHSYCAGISAATIAETDYNDIFSAALQHNNFYGVQFHPERSGEAGALILKNFIQL
jgi:glutamine amidotransferase